MAATFFALAAGMAAAFFAPDYTREGELPPWEVAKAVAYKHVLDDISQHAGTPAFELVGSKVTEYIASKLTTKGGGTITARPVQKVLTKCSDPKWYTGVEDHMNSPKFTAPHGTGLLGLAKELRSRCEAVILAKGERLSK